MRPLRLLAALVTATLFAALAPVTPAGAATDGVGTATADATALQLTMADGSTLSVAVGGDESSANIDPSSGPVAASVGLAPLSVTSTLAPALDQTVDGPSASTSGGTQSVQPASAIDLSTAATSGTLSPPSLEAAVDDLGARASLTAELRDLGIAGLVTVPDVDVTLQTDSAGDRTLSRRSASIGSLDLLDLGALLSGLGLPIGNLTPATVGDLLHALGVTVPLTGSGLAPTGTTELASGSDVTSLIGSVDDAVSALQAVADALAVPATVCDVAAPLLAPLFTAANTALGGLGVDPVDCSSDLSALMATLRSELAGVLSDTVTTAVAKPLLGADLVDVDLLAKATDDPSTSEASAQASIADFSVGGSTVDGLASLGDVSAVTDRAAALTGAVGDVLGVIDASLSDLVQVTFGQPVTSIQSAGRTVTADAALTVLTITATPPDGLSSIVAALDPASSIAEAITSRGGTLPDVAPGMQDLDSTLGTEGAALATGPTGLAVLALHNRSTYTAPEASSTPVTQPPESSTTSPPLPATGGNTGAAAGIALVALGLGEIGWRRLRRSRLSRS